MAAFIYLPARGIIRLSNLIQIINMGIISKYGGGFMTNYTETVIDSKDRIEVIKIKEIMQYKDLLILLVKRNFTLLYKQTILGPLWLILNPLLTSLMYSLVFGQIAGLETDGIPHLIFYLFSICTWDLFSNIVNSTSKTFLVNKDILGKVYFPRLIMPFSQAITSMINFLLQFFVASIILFVYIKTGTSITVSAWSLLIIPLMMVHLALLGLGIGLFFTSITVKYRDLALTINLFLQLLMYASAVIYPVSSMGGIIKKILLLNPITSIVSNMRYFVLGIGELLIGPWILSFIISICMFIVGCIIFNKTQKTFIDSI